MQSVLATALSEIVFCVPIMLLIIKTVKEV